MPPDKHNSIVAKVIGLISTLLCPKMCLLANRSSSNDCIMVLPKLTFVLLCAPFATALWVTILGAHIMALLQDLLCECQEQIQTFGKDGGVEWMEGGQNMSILLLHYGRSHIFIALHYNYDITVIGHSHISDVVKLKDR